MTPTAEQWKSELERLRKSYAAYLAQGLEGELMLVVIDTLRERYQAGERTSELYRAMQAVE